MGQLGTERKERALTTTDSHLPQEPNLRVSSGLVVLSAEDHPLILEWNCGFGSQQWLALDNSRPSAEPYSLLQNVALPSVLVTADGQQDLPECRFRPATLIQKWMNEWMNEWFPFLVFQNIASSLKTSGPCLPLQSNLFNSTQTSLHLS